MTAQYCSGRTNSVVMSASIPEGPLSTSDEFRPIVVGYARERETPGSCADSLCGWVPFLSLSFPYSHLLSFLLCDHPIPPLVVRESAYCAFVATRTYSAPARHFDSPPHDTCPSRLHGPLDSADSYLSSSLLYGTVVRSRRVSSRNDSID